MLDSQVSARKAVLVSMVALLGIAYYRSAKGEDTGSVYRRLWGVGVLGIALSVAADFAPSIAGPFAVLTVLGSLSNGGDRALQQLLGKVASAGPGVAPAASSSVSPAAATVQSSASTSTAGRGVSGGTSGGRTQ